MTIQYVLDSIELLTDYLADGNVPLAMYELGRLESDLKYEKGSSAKME